MIRPGDEFRRPPQNLDAERGALGAAMLDASARHEVVARLTPEDFLPDAHQVLFRALRDLHERGGAVDAITLADELERRGEVEAVGGLGVLSEVLDATPHAANAAYHAAIVREKATLRRLAEAASETLEDVYGGRLTAPEAVASAERRVLALGESDATGGTRPIGVALDEALARISRRAAGECGGVATGFRDVDNLTDGLADASLVVLAARPSMGKTALALQVCAHAALRGGVPSLFVSLEMGGVELAERLLVGLARVDGHRVRLGVLSAADRESLVLARDAARGGEGRLWVDDTAARSVSQVAANARRLKARHGLGLVVVDYLQLLGGGPEGDRASRQEVVASFSRGLKTLARELAVPVLALSQLNRSSETREDHRPRLADLRESGAIENDADQVWLLHRPEYYDPNDQPGVAELIVAKARNGPTDTVRLVFERHLTRFADFAPEGDVPAADF